MKQLLAAQEVSSGDFLSEFCGRGGGERKGITDLINAVECDPPDALVNSQGMPGYHAVTIGYHPMLGP